MALQIPQFGSQVQADAAPTIRVDENASLADFGGGQAASDTAAAAAKTTEVATSFYDMQKKAADDQRGQDVYSKAVQLKNKLLYDPQTGAMSKKGQDALNVTQDYMDQYNKQMADVASGLSNDTQRDQFNKINRVVADDLNTSLSKHVYGETQDLQKQTFETTIATSHDDTADNYQNAGKVQNSLQFQENVIRDQARKLGIPTFIADQQVKDNQSTQLAAVLRRAIDNDDPNLEAMKKEYLPLITNEKVVESLDKPLAEASVRQQSRTSANQIISEGGSYEEQLAKARALPNVKEADETVKRLVDQRTQELQAHDQMQKQTFNDLTQLAYASKGDTTTLPINKLNLLSGEQREAIGKISNQVRTGFQAEAGGKRFYDLQQLAAGDPDAFGKMDLSLERPNMQTSELTKLYDLQAQVTGKADDAGLKGLRNRVQVVNQTLKAAGIKDPNDVQAFNRALDDQIALEFSDGKKPNGKDIQRMSDDLVVKSRVKGGGFLFGDSFNQPAFKSQPGDQLAVDFKNIPVSWRTQAIATLKKNGKDFSNDAVENYYSRYLSNQNSGRLNGQ